MTAVCGPRGIEGRANPATCQPVRHMSDARWRWGWCRIEDHVRSLLSTASHRHPKRSDEGAQSRDLGWNYRSLRSLGSVEPLSHGYAPAATDTRIIREFLSAPQTGDESTRGMNFAGLSRSVGNDSPRKSLDEELIDLTNPSGDVETQRQLIRIVVTLLLNEALVALFVVRDTTLVDASIGVTVGSYPHGDDQEVGDLLTTLVPQLCDALSSPLGVYDCDGCGGFALRERCS